LRLRGQGRLGSPRSGHEAEHNEDACVAVTAILLPKQRGRCGQFPPQSGSIARNFECSQQIISPSARSISGKSNESQASPIQRILTEHNEQFRG
jgi:hypothetical protein